MAALGTPVDGDSSTGGESRLRQSWWSVQTLELGLPKNLVGKSFRQWVVPKVAMAPEWLCDDCNTIGVRRSRWMSRRN